MISTEACEGLKQQCSGVIKGWRVRKRDLSQSASGEQQVQKEMSWLKLNSVEEGIPTFLSMDFRRWRKMSDGCSIQVKSN